MECMKNTESKEGHSLIPSPNFAQIDEADQSCARSDGSKIDRKLKV
jgi:hypothetical protein